MRLQFFAKVAKFRPNLVSLQVLSFNLCVCSPLFLPLFCISSFNYMPQKTVTCYYLQHIIPLGGWVVL